MNNKCSVAINPFWNLILFVFFLFFMVFGSFARIVSDAGLNTIDKSSVVIDKGVRCWAKNNIPVNPGVKAFAINVLQDIGTTVMLTWTATPINVSSYTVRYRKSGTTAWIVNPAYSNQMKISNLLPETQYECEIVTNIAPGYYYSTSPVCSFTTGKVLYATSFDIGTTLMVTWTATQTDVTTWENYSVLYYRITGTTTWLAAPVNGNANNVKLSGLTPGANYECKVVPYYNSYVWGTCQTGSFTTGTVQITRSQDIGTTLLLTWTPFSGTASSYGVQFRPVGSTAWSGQTVYTDPAKVTGFIPDTDYECRVAVYMNGFIWGITQSTTFHTGKVDFIIITDNPTSMEIWWTSFAPWATSYILLYSKPPNPVNYNWLSSPVTTTNMVPIAVLPGQDYFIKLRVFINGVVWGDSEKKKIGRINPVVKESSVNENNDIDLSTGINIYPNPFVEQIMLGIAASEASTCEWALYDMTGKRVKAGNETITTGDNTIGINASDLTKGVYVLNAFMNNEKQSFRIVKQ